MARLFKRGKIYYAWVPKPEGGTKKVSTNCTDERAAHARAAELERIALDPDGAAAAKATLRDALELLIRDRASQAKAGKRSRETVGFYQKKSGVLLDGLAEVLRRSPNAAIFLREVKASLVDDYIYQRREDGVEESTIHKELTTWRAAMRLAKRRGLWTGDIEQVFPKGFSPEYKPGDRWVTPAEFLLLYRAMVRPPSVRQPELEPAKIAELRRRRLSGEPLRELAKEFALPYSTASRLSRREPEAEQTTTEQGHALFAIVCFCIATSAEWSAIWRARREDIAPDLSIVKVRGSKNANREDRPVPIELLPFAYLLDYARRHGDGELADEEGHFLFRASHASNFRRLLGEACKRAGIPHISPTDLRRTHGKWLRLVGVAPQVIGSSMGHADSRMVEMVYGRATGEELAGVQRAQIIHPAALIPTAPSEPRTAGLLMGGDTPKTGPQDSSEETPGAASQRDLRCLDPESNQGHGDFQSTSGSQQTPSDLPRSPTSWAANGQLTAAPGTAGEERQTDGADRRGPPATGRPSDQAPAEDGPGVARARPPLDVDGRPILQEEELSDLGAVFPLVQGGRR